MSTIEANASTWTGLAPNETRTAAPTLFDLEPSAVGRARNTDPATSHLAARKVTRSGSEIMPLVAEVLRAHPQGLTDWETLAKAGLPERVKGSVSKRRHDLGAVKALDADGFELRRNGCQVWRLP